MLITEGRSRAGEGVVTKGQDRPDRSGLVPMTFNSLSQRLAAGFLDLGASVWKLDNEQWGNGPRVEEAM